MIVSVTITGSREAEIGDAIRSVAQHVDKVLLVDTGIGDRTLERAAEAAGSKLHVAKHEWKDFSAARNASIEEAKKLGAEWILIVDSDERIDFKTVDLRAALAQTQAEVLMIESVDGFYPKEKIIRASSGARFVGPTHEALIGGSRETLRGTTFSELGKNGEQLKAKFERDVDILADYVAEHPDDPRWWYYLGQSLEGLGKRLRAAEAYGQCADRRKVGDEAAWAAYKQAEMLFMLERYEPAIVAAGKAIGAHVMYGEAAWMAAVASARIGRPDQATAWARVAEAVGRYKGCGTERAWFRNLPALYELPYDVLRYTLPEGSELRRQAEEDFHKAKLARIGTDSRKGLDRLSVLRSTPPPNRSEAREMLRPARLEEFCPSTKTVKIQFEVPEGRHAMNPSVCWHKGKLWCVVRAINYTLSGRHYNIDDPHGIVRTENYLGTLSPSGELSNPKLMRDLDGSPRQPSMIVGYEDIRLVSLKKKLVGSSTVCDRDPNRRLIAMLDLDREGNVQRATVQPSKNWHEKNWMPVAVGDELHWIYSIDPTIVVSPDKPDRVQDCPLQLEHLRGGAAIEFQAGYLCVAHEVIEANESRIYLHRFVRLNREFRVVAASPAWKFAHDGIEFCAGLVREGGQLILSYGLSDREAWVARVDVKEVEAMEWITADSSVMEPTGPVGPAVSAAGAAA